MIGVAAAWLCLVAGASVVSTDPAKDCTRLTGDAAIAACVRPSVAAAAESWPNTTIEPEAVAEANRRRHQDP